MSLADKLERQSLVGAIRAQPEPRSAVASAAAAVNDAVAAYEPPSLEAKRCVEDAAEAVKQSLMAVEACSCATVAATPSSMPLAEPSGAGRFNFAELLPPGLALVALPFQDSVIGASLILLAVGTGCYQFWKNSLMLVLPGARTLEPPAAEMSLLVDPERLAQAVQRSLLQVDQLVAGVSQRQNAKSAPKSLNNTTLEFLQDLLEVGLKAKGELALARIEARLSAVLAANGLTAVMYDAQDGGRLFDVDGDPTQAVTRRPAIMQEQYCLLRGLASERHS